jgi:magnesium transporter
MSAVLVLLESLAQEHPSDIARQLDRGSAEEVALLLMRLEADTGSRLLSRMNPGCAAAVLEQLQRSAAAALLSAAGPSRAALILSHAGEPLRRAVLVEMKGREAEAVRRLLLHSARTAGSIMDAMVLSVVDDASADEALSHVKQHATHALFYVYVVDRDQRLVGVTTLRELLLSKPDAKLQNVMRERPETIASRASLLAIAAHPGWRYYHAMPVVDPQGVLLGAIRYETARNLERELGQDVRQSDVAETAGALAQLYAIGALGMVEWFSALAPVRHGRKRNQS